MLFTTTASSASVSSLCHTIAPEHTCDLRKRGGRLAFTARGVATVREAVRLQLAEAQLKALRQTVSQGVPRVFVDSGRINVKLTFRLVDLDKLGTRPNGAIVPLKPLVGSAGKATG